MGCTVPYYLIPCWSPGHWDLPRAVNPKPPLQTAVWAPHHMRVPTSSQALVSAMGSRRESHSQSPSRFSASPARFRQVPNLTLKRRYPVANFLGLSPGDQQVMRKLFAPFAHGCPDQVTGGFAVGRPNWGIVYVVSTSHRCYRLW